MSKHSVSSPFCMVLVLHIWLGKLTLWILAPAVVILHEFKKHIYVCCSPFPKHFSQLRNIFLLSLFTPKQILSSRKDGGTQVDVFVVLFVYSAHSPPPGNSVSFTCPLNYLNKILLNRCWRHYCISSRATEMRVHKKPSPFIPDYARSSMLVPASSVAALLHMLLLR